VFRSAKHIYAQVIDDTTNTVLASASDLEEGIQTALQGKKKKDRAKLVRAAVARKLLAKNVDRVVFDRKGFIYHGRVSAVVGTHSHVQTADERILPEGTAYITDLGMTGPVDSVIGVARELAIQRFLSQMPNRFEPAKGPTALHGAVVRIDPESGKALEIRRLRVPVL
jgi:ribosomal protein L18